MISTTEQLEDKRRELLRQLSTLGEFRRGTVSAIYRKCGKPQCWCAKKGKQEGHPQYIWSATIKRKSVGKNLKLGPEVEKYMNETEAYKRFMKICEELVEVNEQICDTRPQKQLEREEELEALKKKLQKQLLKKRTKK